jgi:hypothetical protein
MRNFHLHVVSPSESVAVDGDNKCIEALEAHEGDREALEAALLLGEQWAKRAFAAEYLLELERRECARLRLRLEKLQ